MLSRGKEGKGEMICVKRSAKWKESKKNNGGEGEKRGFSRKNGGGRTETEKQESSQNPERNLLN